SRRIRRWRRVLGRNASVGPGVCLTVLYTSKTGMVCIVPRSGFVTATDKRDGVRSLEKRYAAGAFFKGSDPNQLDQVDRLRLVRRFPTASPRGRRAARRARSDRAAYRGRARGSM